MERIIAMLVDVATWALIMALGSTFTPKPWNALFTGIMFVGGFVAVGKEWYEHYVGRDANDPLPIPDVVEAFTGWWVTPLMALCGWFFALVGRIKIPRPSEWLE